MITIPKKLILYLKCKETNAREKLSTSIFTLNGNYVYINTDIYDLIELEHKVVPDMVITWISDTINNAMITNDDDTTEVENDLIGKQVILCNNEGKFYIN